MSKIVRNIFIAGHKGMVGSAVTQYFRLQQQCKIITQDKSQLNLLNQADVKHFFDGQSIDEIYLAAAKVGGIHANNNYPGQFIYENLMLQCNVIHQAYMAGITKLLFLGSSCIYPKLATQPICESELLNGKLEPTNESYAVAKIAGIKLCQSYNRQYGTDYRCIMPTNLYGPNDNFHDQNAHVIPALMRRIHEAKITQQSSVSAWGTGRVQREFLHVKDMVSASTFVMNLTKKEYNNALSKDMAHINVGSGEDITIKQLAEMLVDIIGYRGHLLFDSVVPDGTPRKLLNIDVLKKIGWKYQTPLYQGLSETYQWFCENQDNFRDK